MNNLEKIQILAQRAIEGLKSQGRLAYDEERTQCALRTPSWDKCAVGMLFDDEHYTRDMEEKASPKHETSTAVRIAIAKSNPDLNLNTNWGQPYWAMLTALQDVHDNASSVQEFVREAKDYIASEWGVVV